MMQNPKDKELIDQYHISKDPGLRDDIILRYLPLVHFTLGRLGISNDLGSDYEDMVSQGLLGLIDAIDRYDPGYGTQFSTYAIIKIRGKVLDYMRSLDWLTRTARSRAKIINEAMNDFWMTNQRIPTDSELATKLNLGVDQVQTALADSSRVIISLDAFDDMENPEEVSLHETLADSTQANPIDILDEEETRGRLIDAIRELPEREQLLLSMYYYENLTFKEIGEVIGVSESRVCQLHARAVVSLKTMMAAGENGTPGNNHKKDAPAPNPSSREKTPPPEVLTRSVFLKGLQYGSNVV